jgi:hypothetical protein
MADLETIFTSFLCKIYKKYNNVDYHSLNKVMKLFIYKLHTISTT